MSLEDRLEEQIRRNEEHLRENEEIMRRTGGDGGNDGFIGGGSDDEDGCGIPIILVFVLLISFISQLNRLLAI